MSSPTLIVYLMFSSGDQFPWRNSFLLSIFGEEFTWEIFVYLIIWMTKTRIKVPLLCPKEMEVKKIFSFRWIMREFWSCSRWSEPSMARINSSILSEWDETLEKEFLRWEIFWQNKRRNPIWNCENISLRYLRSWDEFTMRTLLTLQSTNYSISVLRPPLNDCEISLTWINDFFDCWKSSVDNKLQTTQIFHS